MTTITKNVKVTYKRPKNKRRFNIEDLEILTNVMQEAVQVQYELAEDTETEVLMVDAIFLHDLCSCFIATYQKLIEENLILTGNPSTSSKTIH